MSDKIDLGNGWAKLRDPQEISERTRRPLAKVQRLLGGSDIGAALINFTETNKRDPNEQELAKLLQPYLSDDEMDLFERSNDLLILALTEEWSFDAPITEDSIQDLPVRAYDALRDATQPLLQKILGNESDDDITNPNSDFPATSG